MTGAGTLTTAPSRSPTTLAAGITAQYVSVVDFSPFAARRSVGLTGFPYPPGYDYPLSHISRVERLTQETRVLERRG